MSAQRVIVAQHMRCFFKTSYSPAFFSINYSNSIPQGQMFSLFFPYIVSHTRLFDLSVTYCLSTFLLAYFYWAACLAFIYFTITAWDGVHTIFDHVTFSWVLNLTEIFSNSRATREYCLLIKWTTYLSNLLWGVLVV